MRQTVSRTRHGDVVGGKAKAVSHYHFLTVKLQNKGLWEVQPISDQEPLATTFNVKLGDILGPRTLKEMRNSLTSVTLQNASVSDHFVGGLIISDFAATMRKKQVFVVSHHYTQTTTVARYNDAFIPHHRDITS